MPVKEKESPTKGETTRLAIEDAAIELFLEQGYHATSMRQIAENAGLALGGIYNHFKSKDEIFEGIIIDKHPYRKVLPAILEAEGESAEDFFKNAAKIVMRELGSEPIFMKLMFIEMVEFNGKHGTLMLKEIAPKALPVFEKLVKNRKSLRITNPAVLMRSFFGMIISFYVTEMIIANSVIGKLMPKNPMDVYVDIFLHGILKPEIITKGNSMFNSRISSIIRKEFIQLLRDPRTLAIAVVIPIVQLFLLGYAATSDVRNISMAVWDQNKSPQSRELLDAFRAADYFTIDYFVGSTDEYQKLIESGKARVALVIPADYDRSVLEGNAKVLMVLDGSDSSIGSTALSTARLVGQSYGTKILTQQAALNGRGAPNPPVEVRTQVWYNPDLNSAYYMIPAVIGMILSFITTILTATAVVRERERGTIEQLIVTPIRSWELVLGKLLPYAMLAFVETFEILIIGHFWFGVPVRGSIWLIILTSGLFLMSSLGIGLFASTIANTQQEAMLTVMMYNLPSIFLSGFFFPLQAMPKFLQWISYAIPLRYYLVTIRSLMLKGVGIEAIQSEVIALAIFGVVIMTAAALRFRKRLD